MHKTYKNNSMVVPHSFGRHIKDIYIKIKVSFVLSCLFEFVTSRSHKIEVFWLYLSQIDGKITHCIDNIFVILVEFHRQEKKTRVPRFLVMHDKHDINQEDVAVINTFILNKGSYKCNKVMLLLF